MRERTFFTGILMAVAAGVAGCAGGGASGAAAPEAGGAVAAIENHNWSDVTVYAVVNESKYRLGTVTTSDAEVFRLPRIAPDGLVQLRVEVIGSPEYHVTAPIHVGERGRIDFEVMNHLPMSQYVVRMAAAR